MGGKCITSYKLQLSHYSFDRHLKRHYCDYELKWLTSAHASTRLPNSVAPDHKTQSDLSVANPESKHLDQLKLFKHQQHIWGEGAFSFEKRLMAFAPESQAFISFSLFRRHLSCHIAVAYQR